MHDENARLDTRIKPKTDLTFTIDAPETLFSTLTISSLTLLYDSVILTGIISFLFVIYIFRAIMHFCVSSLFVFLVCTRLDLGKSTFLL